MTTRIHHLHASVIHAPLALIPGAALVDLQAARSRSRVQARLGRKLWWYGAGSALFAGIAGMAASQEVKAHGQRARDTMWLHGVGNVSLIAGAFAMAMWRQRNRPTLAQSLLGLGAAALAGYGSYLGGVLVYEHGAGVAAMPEDATQGVGRSPRLLSAQAPFAFVRDALKGAWWLLSRSRSVLRDPQSLGRAAVGKPAEDSMWRPVESVREGLA